MSTKRTIFGSVKPRQASVPVTVNTGDGNVNAITTAVLPAHTAPIPDAMLRTAAISNTAPFQRQPLTSISPVSMIHKFSNGEAAARQAVLDSEAELRAMMFENFQLRTAALAATAAPEAPQQDETVDEAEALPLKSRRSDPTAPAAGVRRRPLVDRFSVPEVEDTMAVRLGRDGHHRQGLVQLFATPPGKRRCDALLTTALTALHSREAADMSVDAAIELMSVAVEAVNSPSFDSASYRWNDYPTLLPTALTTRQNGPQRYWLQLCDFVSCVVLRNSTQVDVETTNVIGRLVVDCRATREAVALLESWMFHPNCDPPTASDVLRETLLSLGSDTDPGIVVQLMDLTRSVVLCTPHKWGELIRLHNTLFAVEVFHHVCAVTGRVAPGIALNSCLMLLCCVGPILRSNCVERSASLVVFARLQEEPEVELLPGYNRDGLLTLMRGLLKTDGNGPDAQ